ncbi:MAG: MotA/TolQ/ExbB proton channel family protein, partial [Isosphaeraceae bacterium]
VALAAVRRWGRPVVDLDRAVGLAQRIEVERIRRHVGTLRRIAALAPLIGLLGTLTALSRALGGLGTGTTAAVWGPVLAAALWPVTAGVALATLALVAYDGLAGKVEQLSDHLDRIGAETIDAIALALPSSPATSVAPESRAATMLGPAQSHGPHTHAPGHGHGHGHSHPSLGSARSAGHIRMEIPRPAPRPHLDDDDDLD